MKGLKGRKGMWGGTEDSTEKKGRSVLLGNKERRLDEGAKFLCARAFPLDFVVLLF